MKCIENGCPEGVSEGDLIFCKPHREQWKSVCDNPLSDITNNLRILTQIMDKRLSLLRK